MLISWEALRQPHTHTHIHIFIPIFYGDIRGVVGIVVGQRYVDQSSNSRRGCHILLNLEKDMHPNILPPPMSE